ncbi:MAG: DUF4277 domain-containing protein [Bacteroidetes Order II. Incertae sedis bacterium]|nr:DUF4277 domain-containing protein [Bacteroidetes Order II. bacterium]
MDSAIIQETRDRHPIAAWAVKVMIINGLCFSQWTLYMTSKFFENLPIDILLGPNISANHLNDKVLGLNDKVLGLNDKVLGRALDSVYDYGCTKLYRERTFHMGKS